MTIKQILAWADAHHKRTGRWPAQRSGPVHEAPDEVWRYIDDSLRSGHRKLPGGSSLAHMLARHRKVINVNSRPRLTVKQILAWADAHHKRTGRWPVQLSGPVHEVPGESWSAVDGALREGHRQLPGGSSLAQVLARDRNVRNAASKPRLTVKQILAWADAHHKRTGKWPKDSSGPVHEAPDETWTAISQALSSGRRGLPRGGSLAKLLQKHGRKRNRHTLSRLSIKQILAWADAHHTRTGKWPINTTGPVHEAPNERWATLSGALANGRRGLPRGGSLTQLLAKHGRHALPPLSIKQILAWADAHHKRMGRWPVVSVGPVHEAPDENWAALSQALHNGSRGLPRGGSLAQLLAKHGRKRIWQALPQLPIEQILAWADAHHRRTGKWPKKFSGKVHGTRTEKWLNIDNDLRVGYRGFSGGHSLPQLLEQRRSVRNINRLPRLTIKQILKWADAHRKRNRRWPKYQSGPIPRSGGETWHRIHSALVTGRRGLRSGNSLPKVLERHRGVRNIGDLPALRIQQILRWADSHHKRTGKWPKMHSGAIPEVPGEKWSTVDEALARGLRGLRRGSSLPRLLSKHRRVRNHMDLPKLSTKQILKWADAFYKREKGWPRDGSGKISGTGGETWSSINYALKKGNRGMSGGWSLFRFLNRYRRPERGL